MRCLLLDVKATTQQHLAVQGPPTEAGKTDPKLETKVTTVLRRIFFLTEPRFVWPPPLTHSSIPTPEFLVWR